MQEEVGNARDLASRRIALERFLAKRLSSRGHRAADARVPAAVGFILASRGRLPIRNYRAAGLLEREFASGVGLTPKELSRIARFQNLLRLLGWQRRPGPSWAELAARCGYADQAHLVREFKSLSGATPTSRRETEGALARFFIHPARLDALLSPVAFLQDTRGRSALESAAT